MTPETTDITQEILSIVAAHARLSIDTSTLGLDDDLFLKGMTSHASVTVMLELESHFGIEFPDSMLSRSTFESVSAIHAAVAQLLATPQAG